MDEDKVKTPPEFSEEELKMPDGMGPVVEEEHHGKLALILGALIVALVLIFGGLYLWYVNAFKVYEESAAEPTIEREVPDMPNEPEMENSDATIQQLETVSGSDQLGAIEADIEATNLDELDAELDAIDAELDAAIQ